MKIIYRSHAIIFGNDLYSHIIILRSPLEIPSRLRSFLYFFVVADRVARCLKITGALHDRAIYN